MRRTTTDFFFRTASVFKNAPKVLDGGRVDNDFVHGGAAVNNAMTGVCGRMSVRQI